MLKDEMRSRVIENIVTKGAYVTKLEVRFWKPSKESEQPAHFSVTHDQRSTGYGGGSCGCVSDKMFESFIEPSEDVLKVRNLLK